MSRREPPYQPTIPIVEIVLAAVAVAVVIYVFARWRGSAQDHDALHQLPTPSFAKRRSSLRRTFGNSKPNAALRKRSSSGSISKPSRIRHPNITKTARLPRAN